MSTGIPNCTAFMKPDHFRCCGGKTGSSCAVGSIKKITFVTGQLNPLVQELFFLNFSTPVYKM